MTTGAEDARRRFSFEIALVAIVAFVVLLPGIGRYSLVDPWETHYGEVARNMVAGRDLVHMEWPAPNPEGVANEGFRSKPVLTFWLMAAGLRSVGLLDDGGYSGELLESPRTMIGIRLPFVCCAVAGLLLVWWMLAKLVSRRLAWLALLVVGSCPFFCLVARQGIPDMPLVATTMGALALFVLAIEDGDRPVVPRARGVVLGLAGGFVVAQALYYLVYFITSPQLAIPGVPNPALWLPAIMLLALYALSCDGWRIARLPMLAIGGIAAAIARDPIPRTARGWRHFIDDILGTWDRRALDRYIVRGVAYPFVWASGGGWRDTNAVADRALRMAPLATMRQVYLLGCYALLGVSVLAKGPPGLAVVGGVGLFHVLCMNHWRALYDGAFELKRGLILMIATFLPWHVAMYMKDGLRFINDYVFQHLLDRAAVGSVDKSFGTFEAYSSQIGHGMWLWAALLPAAITTTLVATRSDTRAGRVRFTIALWAIVGTAFFSIVQTKFHHYILPVVPALGILVAFFLDDLVAGRARLHPLFAMLGVGIALLVCRDLMHEPKRWIEMFIYRYDRPWPAGEPWAIDPSDAFLALGALAAASIALAATRFRRLGVAALCVSGLAICVWALQVYMPIAGTHWGMRSAIHTYYEQRTIYGETLVYFGGGELYDDWQDTGDTWSFDTFIPQTLQIGQPIALSIEVRKADDERVIEQQLSLVATATAIGAHSIEVTLAPGERAKLAELVKRGANAPRGRPPIRAVDADRLIAWQLYWRGEQFWPAGEVWGWLPTMKTTFQKANNTEITSYLNDRTRAPIGRRYFVITDSGKISSVRSLPPTQRGRDTFEILDTTSNKFSLAAFWL